MARVTFSGEPGTAFVNESDKLLWQFICQFQNSCALCISYHHAIGPYWPIPLHRGDRCNQIPVPPGTSAAPYVDHIEEIRKLDPAQRAAVMGKANWQLVESGAVDFRDVVTPTRVRTLAEVVSREKLSVAAMVKAGVNPGAAERAYASVNTPAHELAEANRKALVAALAAKGVPADRVRAVAAGKLAARVGISGPGVAAKVKGSSAPLLPQVAAKLGIQPSAAPPLTIHGDVSEGVVAEARRVVESLPSAVREVLADYGAAIKVGRTMADVAPDIVNDHPRGWPEGMTWANAEGAYRGDTREVIATELKRSLATGADVPTSRFAGVLRHEIGHAVDDAMGGGSKHSQFRAAYDEDIGKMGAADRAMLAYFLQPGGAGQREAFAELFGTLTGGGSASWLDLPAVFPSTAELMRGLLR